MHPFLVTCNESGCGARTTAALDAPPPDRISLLSHLEDGWTTDGLRHWCGAHRLEAGRSAALRTPAATPAGEVARLEIDGGSSTRAWNLIVEGHEIERRRIAHRAKRLLFYLDLHLKRDSVSLQVTQAMEDLRDAVDEGDWPALVPVQESTGLITPSTPR